MTIATKQNELQEKINGLDKGHALAKAGLRLIGPVALGTTALAMLIKTITTGDGNYVLQLLTILAAIFWLRENHMSAADKKSLQDWAQAAAEEVDKLTDELAAAKAEIVDLRSPINPANVAELTSLLPTLAPALTTLSDLAGHDCSHGMIPRITTSDQAQTLENLDNALRKTSTRIADPRAKSLLDEPSKAVQQAVNMLGQASRQIDGNGSGKSTTWVKQCPHSTTDGRSASTVASPSPCGIGICNERGDCIDWDGADFGAAAEAVTPVTEAMTKAHAAVRKINAEIQALRRIHGSLGGLAFD